MKASHLIFSPIALLDKVLPDPYGWAALNLDHDFFKAGTIPENDRVRYTISPVTCKEVLKRLPAENHRRAALSIAKRGRKSKSDDTHGDFFA
ncbi:MAG: hypothetical protein KIT07_01165 [Anaerolineales bacterium]|nr:hypothetical protein [Anaerolineales bacterium]